MTAVFKYRKDLNEEGKSQTGCKLDETHCGSVYQGAVPTVLLNEVRIPSKKCSSRNWMTYQGAIERTTFLSKKLDLITSRPLFSSLRC